ncbi:hypothetical protein Tco_1466942 [Tanacetum coccineum]
MSTEVPTSNMIVMTLMPELESLFGPLFDEYLNGENQVVLKPFVVTTAAASDKRQKQPDSTSTLKTSVTADGNIEFVKEIALPQDVPSTSDRRLIKLENQVQRLIEAHLAPTQPT